MSAVPRKETATGSATEHSSRAAPRRGSKARSRQADFLTPTGDPGLTGPGSVTWRVFNHPFANAVGGIAAVILELAEPAVRAGVWDHSTFPVDPIGRMENTGMAAQAIVYGSTQVAERTIQRVNRMHEHVAGETHAGVAYRATDPELITWVHVTAGWGFLNAHIRYVEPEMSLADQNRYHGEREAAGYGFGAKWVPATVDEVNAYMSEMTPKLYANDTVQEFIGLVGDATPMGAAARPLQRLLAQAAIDLLTEDMQRACGVSVTHPLGQGLRHVVKSLTKMSRFAQRFATDGPAQLACRRMGVSTDCLYP